MNEVELATIKGGCHSGCGSSGVQQQQTAWAGHWMVGPNPYAGAGYGNYGGTSGYNYGGTSGSNDGRTSGYGYGGTSMPYRGYRRG